MDFNQSKSIYARHNGKIRIGDAPVGYFAQLVKTDAAARARALRESMAAMVSEVPQAEGPRDPRGRALRAGPLSRAVRFLPSGAPGAAEVSELLERDDWEAALLLLEESTEAFPQPSEFWDLLADAAHLLWLHDDARWYGWRSTEVGSGVVLAELRLGDRRSPVPSCGLLRPMWDVGRTTPDGDPLFGVAGLWIDGVRFLEPGGRGASRLIPLTFEFWGHLRPGDVITMHEIRDPVGVARVTEIRLPMTPG